MAEIDFMGVLHKSTQRNYLARVNDPDFPKAKAVVAKQFDLSIGMEIGGYATADITTLRDAGRK